MKLKTYTRRYKPGQEIQLPDGCSYTTRIYYENPQNPSAEPIIEVVVMEVVPLDYTEERGV